MEGAAAVRIGELSRRTGVSVELLRAWERRYGLLRPSRSAGGFRLYSDDDERRVRRMQEHLRQGRAAAEAARAAVAESEVPGGVDRGAAPLAAGREQLRRALDHMDERGAHAALDVLLAAFTIETVLTQVVLPYLADLGERWERGEATVAQEHFASNLLRGRLLALGRNWDHGTGPRALLACAPGELHDLPLIAFGLALAGHGWRVTFLGPDTPIDSLRDAVAALNPDAVIVSATLPGRLEGLARQLKPLARTTKLYLAGAGASAADARSTGARLLEDDPVSAATTVA
jgi:DNA-binding transcriptional MerR regulator